MLIPFDPLEEFGRFGKIEQRDMGEFAVIRRSGMRFESASYRLEGVGYFSTIRTKAMLGLMQMESLILTPLEVDMPLLSYDVMHLPGKDLVLLEIFDTQLIPADRSVPGMFAGMEEVKARYAYLPDRETPPGCSAEMSLPQSIEKKGRKLLKKSETMVTEWLAEYMSLLAGAPKCDREKKRKATRRYTDRLFTEGGVAVNQFKKMLGEEAAVKMLGEFIFCCDAP